MRRRLTRTRGSSKLAVLLVTLVVTKEAMAIETPTYRVTQRFDAFEIRAYADQIVAETEVEGSLEDAGNQAFGKLAGYIFGKNQGDKKIAMTAPVTQTRGIKIAMTAPVTQATLAEGRYVVRFTMPADYSMDSLPKPLDASVRLAAVPGKRLAVLRYSGTWSRRNYEEHLAKLRQALVAQGVSVVGEPIWARYDPPWKPWFLRHNEIMFEVADSEPQTAN